MHIMWYEYKMVPEALDSLYNALQYSKNNPKINICLNYQTYLETPIEGTPEDMFNEILDHPVFKIANVIKKTNEESFYGIGDWRREQYNQNGYTVWGESDCIMPYDLFYILENLKIDHPHILSFSSRKMWDYTWSEVEFTGLDKYSYEDMDQTCPSEFHFNGCVLDQKTLDLINDKEGDVRIIKIDKVKFDGALFTLSKGIPTPFIAPGQQLTNEDFCAQQYFQYLNIPQYHIKNRMKGHNGYHPLKRMNTYENKMIGHRSEESFTKIAERSKEAMYKFLQEKIKI